MSSSTNAILFYGLPIDRASDIHERIEEEMRAYDGRPGDTLAHRYVDYVESDGEIGVGAHCSGEDPMYFVFAKKFTARRGDIVTPVIDVDPVWTGIANAKLRAFCDKYAIPWQEPRWCLVSWWSAGPASAGRWIRGGGKSRGGVS